MNVVWLGRLSDNAVQFVGTDQFAFALVPGCENFGGWGTAENAWVDETWEADVGNVAR